jgi:hypothetical protein
VREKEARFQELYDKKTSEQKLQQEIDRLRKEGSQQLEVKNFQDLTMLKQCSGSGSALNWLKACNKWRKIANKIWFSSF